MEFARYITCVGTEIPNHATEIEHGLQQLGENGVRLVLEWYHRLPPTISTILGFLGAAELRKYILAALGSLGAAELEGLIVLLGLIAFDLLFTALAHCEGQL
jgi:hypothetical protein